jgi:hypothetical protein
VVQDALFSVLTDGNIKAKNNLNEEANHLQLSCAIAKSGEGKRKKQIIQY